VLSVFDMLASGGRRLLGRLCVAAAAVQSLQGVRGCFQVSCACVCCPPIKCYDGGPCVMCFTCYTEADPLLSRCTE
jgi:hypothetical protein